MKSAGIEALNDVMGRIVSYAGLLYSADTGPRWDPSGFGDGVDLFVCEATFTPAGEGDDGVHLSARQAGALAAKLGARRLVVTHVAPELADADQAAAASEAFGGPVDAAVTNATNLDFWQDPRIRNAVMHPVRRAAFTDREFGPMYDAGLHNQVWMLRFATAAAFSWNGKEPSLEEFRGTFLKNGRTSSSVWTSCQKTR